MFILRQIFMNGFVDRPEKHDTFVQIVQEFLQKRDFFQVRDQLTERLLQIVSKQTLGTLAMTSRELSSANFSARLEEEMADELMRYAGLKAPVSQAAAPPPQQHTEQAAQTPPTSDPEGEIVRSNGQPTQPQLQPQAGRDVGGAREDTALFGLDERSLQAIRGPIRALKRNPNMSPKEIIEQARRIMSIADALQSTKPHLASQLRTIARQYCGKFEEWKSQQASCQAGDLAKHLSLGRTPGQILTAGGGAPDGTGINAGEEGAAAEEEAGAVDGLFLNHGPLMEKLKEVLARHGMCLTTADMEPFLNKAVESHVTGLLQRMCRVAEQRLDPFRRAAGVELTSDKRRGVLSIQRRDQQHERERLLLAQKLRSQPASLLERVEEVQKEEQVKRQSEAANAAMRASFGKKAKWEELFKKKAPKGGGSTKEMLKKGLLNKPPATASNPLKRKADGPAMRSEAQSGSEDGDGKSAPAAASPAGGSAEEASVLTSTGDNHHHHQQQQQQQPISKNPLTAEPTCVDEGGPVTGAVVGSINGPPAAVLHAGDGPRTPPTESLVVAAVPPRRDMPDEALVKQRGSRLLSRVPEGTQLTVRDLITVMEHDPRLAKSSRLAHFHNL